MNSPSVSCAEEWADVIGLDLHVAGVEETLEQAKHMRLHVRKLYQAQQVAGLALSHWPKQHCCTHPTFHLFQPFQPLGRRGRRGKGTSKRLGVGREEEAVAGNGALLLAHEEGHVTHHGLTALVGEKHLKASLKALNHREAGFLSPVRFVVVLCLGAVSPVQCGPPHEEEINTITF